MNSGSFIFLIISTSLLVFAVYAAKSPSLASLLSTKTAYRNSGLQSFMPENSLAKDSRCRLVYLNTVLRHGSRSSSFRDVDAFKSLKQKLMQSAKKGAVFPPGLLSTPIPFENQTAEFHLIPSGYREHFLLGEWFQSMSKRLGGFSLNAKNTNFFSTSKQRTIDSAEAFQDGVFGVGHGPKPIANADPLLRFYDICPRYQKCVKKNKLAQAEVQKFKLGSVFQRMLSDFLTKHRLDSSSKVTADDMLTAYNICGFELLQLNSTPVELPPWCRLFELQQLEVIEYLRDLSCYWIKSYAYEITYTSACPLMVEILNQLSEVASNLQKGVEFNSLHRGTFWFGHVETLLPLLALLDVANESIAVNYRQALLASTFAEHQNLAGSQPQSPLLFRSSNLTPMAANIAFALYQCKSTVGGAGASEQGSSFPGFHVELLVNGRNVAWSLAGSQQPPTVKNPGALHTTLDHLLATFEHCMPDHFNFNEACQRPCSSEKKRFASQ